MLDTYRQEDPVAFAEDITDPEVDPLIAETLLRTSAIVRMVPSI